MRVRSVIISSALLINFSNISANAATIQLPQTGQTSCYNDYGLPVDCSLPAVYGQDGQKLSGVAWPTPRFTDNSNGTVTDNLTGLVWLQKTDCFDSHNWQDALNSANGLADGSCELTDSSVQGDWRLPNIVELESLLDLGRSMPSIPADNPFSGLQNGFFWTSTTYVDDPGSAWINDFSDSFKGSNGYKYELNLFLPVRNPISTDPSHPPAILQLPASGQAECWLWSDIDGAYQTVDCTGTGQDGDKKTGAVWPVPRFVDNSDGTVTDKLTGLVWLQNAGCTDLGEKSWIDALNTVNNLKGDNTVCGLNDGSQQNVWRLPNRRELSSLLDHQYSVPAITPSTPFQNLPDETVLSSFYWTSSTVVNDRVNAWVVDLYDGYAMLGLKNDPFKIWPVRDVVQNSAPVITEGDSVSAVMSKNGIPTRFSLSLHATDADKDLLSWSVTVAPADGSATIETSGGSVAVSYIPVAGFTGQDSFTVQVSDGRGGIDLIVVNVTVNQTYIVHPSVSGNGSIFPATEQILNSGASTTLTVYPGADSYIAGVTGCSGALSANSYLTGAVTDNCFVFANFKITQVKVLGNAFRTDFNTLQEAYSNPSTLDDMILMARITDFWEDINLDRSINIKLTGGYDAMFQPTTEFSTIQGKVSISSGSLTVDKVIIQ